jgi:hypothetical protein
MFEDRIKGSSYAAGIFSVTRFFLRSNLARPSVRLTDSLISLVS